ISPSLPSLRKGGSIHMPLPYQDLRAMYSSPLMKGGSRGVLRRSGDDQEAHLMGGVRNLSRHERTRSPCTWDEEARTNELPGRGRRGSIRCFQQEVHRVQRELDREVVPGAGAGDLVDGVSRRVQEGGSGQGWVAHGQADFGVDDPPRGSARLHDLEALN